VTSPDHAVGSACWFDLGVADIDAAAAFYRDLFGWVVTESDQAGYRLASSNGQLIAGFGPAEDPPPPYWTVYLRTADISASLRDVAAAGGTVLVPPTAAGDAGTSATVCGPAGAPLSFWQPSSHLGTATTGGHGTVSGVRLCTGSPDKAGAFLGAALGWRMCPDGTIDHHGRTVATWARTSSVDLAHWLVRFRVTDPVASRRRALELGACPTDEGPDILLDPAGAVFGLAPLG